MFSLLKSRVEKFSTTYIVNQIPMDGKIYQRTDTIHHRIQELIDEGTAPKNSKKISDQP